MNEPLITNFTFVKLSTLQLFLSDKKNNGNLQTNIRISISEEKRSKQAQRQVDRLYARYQPHQPVYVYSLPDHPGNKIIFVINLKWMWLLWQMHFLPG